MSHDEIREEMADLFMDLRLDGPRRDDWTYQQTARHYADIIVSRVIEHTAPMTHTVEPTSVLVCPRDGRRATQDHHDDGTVTFRHMTERELERELAEAARAAARRFAAAARPAS